MTLIGFLAPLLPPLELTNHFRPLTLGGCLMGLLIAFGFGRRRAATSLAILAGTNASIVLAASSFAASSMGEAGTARGMLGRARGLDPTYVRASPQIKSVAFSTGPWLGSDHLPVVATVGLP
jgi:hypothetical protein